MSHQHFRPISKPHQATLAFDIACARRLWLDPRPDRTMAQLSCPLHAQSMHPKNGRPLNYRSRYIRCTHFWKVLLLSYAQSFNEWHYWNCLHCIGGPFCFELVHDRPFYVELKISSCRIPWKRFCSFDILNTCSMKKKIKRPVALWLKDMLFV